MALPNFLVVGAERAGTTPLCRILVQHPDIFMPEQKETHFFTRMFGRFPLAMYEGTYFHGAKGEKAVGEATPEYMRFPEVPQRLREALGPELKLVFCLREPVRRAFSQYHLRCRLLEEAESFARAIELEPQRLARNRYRGLRCAYLGGSRYAEQIRRFLEVFPRESLFFMVLEEDFAKERARTLERLFAFLGVAPAPGVKLDVADSSRAAPGVRIVEPGRRLHLRTAPDGTEALDGPAIVFLSGNPGADRVIRNPSQAALAHFRRLAAQLTVELPGDFARELYLRHFRDGIGELEALLGRDLSCWRRW